MDAPPPQEDCRPFAEIAGFLAQAGLNSARVLEADFERGFLLLSDLGSTQYLQALQQHPENSTDLYKDAMDALLQMQIAGSEFKDQLPRYDQVLLRAELDIFRDWLCGYHLGIEFSTQDEQAWHATCELLVDAALRQTQVAVHRDFHSRNLMVTPKDNPGVLDFQDMVCGPLTYDLVSLLKDCYIKSPPEDIRINVEYFHRSSPDASSDSIDNFVRDFDWMGTQRHLKAAGIFSRLLHRDGKKHYLQDIPRTLEYVSETTEIYSEFEFLGELLRDRVLPALHEASQ
jgi:aminoglycoside/choline kinase family phosphotransferase